MTAPAPATEPDPYQYPCDPDIPWITLKDLFWALYLYPGHWLAGNPLRNLTQRAAQLVFQACANAQKKDAMHNLVTAFGADTPAPDLRHLARSFIANSVRRSFDDFSLARDEATLRCLSFTGREHLDAALAAGKGVLLASLHWFAGRAGNRYLASIGYPVLSIRNGEPRDKRMGRLGRRFLQPRYVRFLHEVIRDEVFIQDRECTLKILARLRSGGIVNILLDAAFSQQAMRLPFLGRMRRFPMGPLHLARISGCAVIPMLTLGHAEALEIRIGPPLEIDRGLDADTLCRARLPELVGILESQVLANPDQWELWTRI